MAGCCFSQSEGGRRSGTDSNEVSLTVRAGSASLKRACALIRLQGEGSIEHLPVFQVAHIPMHDDALNGYISTVSIVQVLHASLVQVMHALTPAYSQNSCAPPSLTIASAFTQAMLQVCGNILDPP